MAQHPNAKLTPKGRETLVSRMESGIGVAEAARQMGVSRQTACKWLRRSRSGEASPTAAAGRAGWPGSRLPTSRSGSPPRGAGCPGSPTSTA